MNATGTIGHDTRFSILQFEFGAQRAVTFTQSTCFLFRGQTSVYVRSESANIVRETTCILKQQIKDLQQVDKILERKLVETVRDTKWTIGTGKEKGSKRKSCRGSVLEATRYCSQAPPDLHLYRLSANNASNVI
ncbi:unnamed protein product [Xylocopa violacea]|uniref:Uncharacterized protein n=1 Tax=Xylocopa violacea TaxID=135666 RepID=A0ABP1N9V6_XYLVO